jgi:glycosyltransferase involved in cell wall biosynthesis
MHNPLPRVAVDLSIWHLYKGGIANFIENTLRRMIEDRSLLKIEIVLIIPKQADKAKLDPAWNEIEKLYVNYPNWMGKLRSVVYDQFVLLSALKRARAAALFCPWINAPILFNGKTYVTIHDLQTLWGKYSYRKSLPGLYYNLLVKFWLKRAHKILTVSEFSKSELLALVPEPDSRLVVLRNSLNRELSSYVDDHLDAQEPASKRDEFLIFYSGGSSPRKRIDVLIKAFLEIKKQFVNVKLIITGEEQMYAGAGEPAGLKEVQFTGKLSYAELAGWYRKSDAVVYTSEYEGYGFPVLEALAFGKPIVCNNISSLREVGGDAAIYYHRNSVESLSKELALIINSAEMRHRLRDRSRERYRVVSTTLDSQNALQRLLS